MWFQGMATLTLILIACWFAYKVSGVGKYIDVVDGDDIINDDNEEEQDE